MSEPCERWLDQLQSRNRAFASRIQAEKLPVARAPGRFALVTCMDPRINPEALGIAPFGPQGSGYSDVRVIRTIGGMAEDRSLMVAIHLAGVSEVAIVMHTDCGNRLAKVKIDSIEESLERNLTESSRREFAAQIGEPFRENLVAYLKAFDDPRDAVRREVETVRRKAFVPANVIVHGLTYELATAKLSVVVDGYP